MRSPPLRGVATQEERPCGEGPEIARGEVFSEGSALRVRIARPDASPGYGMITEERTNGRWPNREMLRSSASLSRGRAEPAPPRNGQAMAGSPYGDKPGDGAKWGFLGGAHSVRPRCEAGCEPWDGFSEIESLATTTESTFILDPGPAFEIYLARGNGLPTNALQEVGS